jgi:curli biogenesis system outer membrane secretion channel CsgG
MINFEIFMLGLLITSTLTALATEAVKSILAEHNVEYRANTLAGIVATIISLAVGIGYVVVTNAGFTSHIIVCLIAQVFMSWLCSMVGYDKVVQAISQFKTTKKES